MNTNKTIETYDKYAHIYDEEVIDFWAEFPKTVLTRFYDALPGKRVLNLGSGSGRDALLLRAMGLEVVCVDASQTMVKMTQELGFESHVADFAAVDFTAGSFDGVWAYTSLIHITSEETEVILDRMHSALRSKGMLLFGAIQGEGERMVERKTMPDTLRYFKFYKREELKELVEKCGFAFVVEEDYTPHTSTYLNQLYERV